MAISRMQNPQQLQGIGSLRQPYGLGKLVKKAFKGVKKIAKSPLGKAALIGLGGWGLSKYGLGASGIGKGWFGKMMGKQLGSRTLGGWAKAAFNPWQSGKFSGKHAFGLLGAGAIAAPFIQKSLGWGPYQEEEEEPAPEWSVTPSNISNIIMQARNQDPSLNFLPSSAYAGQGFYAADGGRAGLLNGGEAGQAQMEQMLRAEYVKYRNQGGTMPYEQFKILIMQQAQQGQQGQTPNQMMEDGGRAGYRWGRDVEQETDFIQGPQGDEEFSETLMASDPNWEDEWDQIYENYKARQIELGLDFVDKETFMMDYQDNMAQGGRAGHQEGELVGQETDFIQGPHGGDEFQETVVEGQEQPSREQLEALAMEIFQLPLEELDEQQLLVVYQEAMQGQPMEEVVQEENVQFAANGGIMGGDDEDELTYNPYRAMQMYKRTGKQEGGLMDLQGQEKDYRDEGGFVALGGEERADDVPARLSKNEFVFTADAVRNAGGGDIDKGSEVMQNVMDNLEQGGEVSEDSQGLGGGEEIMSEEIIDESNPAQGMYDNYEQLQSRVA